MTTNNTETTKTSTSKTTTRKRAGKTEDKQMTEEQRISAMNIETKLLMIESEIGPIVKTLQVKQEDGGYSTLSDAEILRAA